MKKLFLFVCVIIIVACTKTLPEGVIFRDVVPTKVDTNLYEIMSDNRVYTVSDINESYRTIIAEKTFSEIDKPIVMCDTNLVMTCYDKNIIDQNVEYFFETQNKTYYVILIAHVSETIEIGSCFNILTNKIFLRKK